MNHFIVSGKDTYEPILKADITESFEEYVVSRVNMYKDFTVEELCENFQIEFKRRPKNLEAMIAHRILWNYRESYRRI